MKSKKNYKTHNKSFRKHKLTHKVLKAQKAHKLHNKSLRKHKLTHNSKKINFFTRPKKHHVEKILINQTSSIQSVELIPGLRNMK